MKGSKVSTFQEDIEPPHSQEPPGGSEGQLCEGTGAARSLTGSQSNTRGQTWKSLSTDGPVQLARAGEDLQRRPELLQIHMFKVRGGIPRRLEAISDARVSTLVFSF